MPDDAVSYAARIAQLAAELGDEPVYRHVSAEGDEQPFGWATLHRRSSQLAAALADRGVTRGSRIAVGFDNSPQLVLSVLAAWKLGAVPVPVRWDVPEWELRRILDVVTPTVHLGLADRDWVDATAELAVPRLPDAESPQAFGICSGGTTGVPKVILHGRPSRFEPGANAVMAAHWRPIDRPQRILVPGPLYHVAAFFKLRDFLAGDRIVVMARFDAARLVDLVEGHRITTFSATPTMLRRIVDLPGVDERDFSSLVWIHPGGAATPPALVRRLTELIGPEKIVLAYGMTEDLGRTVIRGDEWLEHPGSVGRPYGDTEIRILGPDGAELPTGEVGEIYLRSALTEAYAYLGGPRLPGTADGFQTAGDLGHLDAAGYLYVADRRVDMIITGGANVFPAEVEAALIDHPEVADVVVIGLRDPEWGRRVHALVEAVDPAAPPSVDDILVYAKTRLAPYKVPKTVEFVASMPRNEASKINRRALVEARGG